MQRRDFLAGLAAQPTAGRPETRTRQGAGGLTMRGLNLSGFQLFDTLEGLPDQRVPRLTLR